jgi:hypothetical protein
VASPTLAFGRIAFRDTLRRAGFRIGAACFAVAAGLASIPFSPGVAAEPRQYAEAGISTLLLGGVFLALMMVPLILVPGRGRTLAEELLALPLSRAAWVMGSFAGFGAALLLYFLCGMLLLLLLGSLAPACAVDLSLLPALGRAWFFALVAAALVLMTSRFLDYVAALTAAILVLGLGYASVFMPLPVALFFPALGHLDPLSSLQRPLGEALLHFLHGASCIGLYLYIACMAAGRRQWA